MRIRHVSLWLTTGPLGVISLSRMIDDCTKLAGGSKMKFTARETLARLICSSFWHVLADLRIAEWRKKIVQEGNNYIVRNDLGEVVDLNTGMFVIQQLFSISLCLKPAASYLCSWTFSWYQDFILHHSDCRYRMNWKSFIFEQPNLGLSVSWKLTESRWLNSRFFVSSNGTGAEVLRNPKFFMST